MKKKILSISLVLALIAVLATGTLAYFTDSETADNVFVMKGVSIDLEEDFDPEDADDIVPDTTVTKGVEVTNIGTTDAYVRVQIAVPADLDDGFVTLNTNGGNWSWTKKDGTTANTYTASINNEEYVVYVGTYTEALAANEATATKALESVYISKDITCEENTQLGGYDYFNAAGTKANYRADGTFHIYVIAEGTQKNPFDNAFDALDAAFGEPGNYTVAW